MQTAVIDVVVSARIILLSVAVLVHAGATTLRLNAQQSCRSEVASIRPSSGELSTRERKEGAGTVYRASSLAVTQLLYEAFAVKDHAQVVGYPKWVDTEMFDITAKVAEADGGCLSKTALAAEAIKGLLVERFGLRYHVEERPIAVFGLNVIPGRFKLKPVVPAAEYLARFPDGDNRIFPPARVEADAMTMNGLARLVSVFTEHYVVDRTGLTGRYDFVLTFDQWMPKGVQRQWSEVDGEAGPPIGFALEEQMGLRLLREKVTLPVVVVDGILRPSGN